MKEISFDKYNKKGAGFHWQQVGHNPLKKNVFVLARYQSTAKIMSSEGVTGKILDVGCGDGVLCSMMARPGVQVFGIDPSPEAIEYAKKRLPHIDFRLGSAYELPFEKASIDNIASTEVIEHLDSPEKMLEEIARVWSGKGKIIITTPIRFTEQPLDRMHVQEFFPAQFEDTLMPHFPGCEINVVKSHPIFWMELLNKQIWGKPLFSPLFSLLNTLTGFNPFNNSAGKWRYYALQTAVIKKSA